MSDCVKRLIEQSNGIFDKTEARKLLKDVEAIAKKKAAQGFDYDDAVKQTLADHAINVKQNLEKQKLNTLRNVAKNKGMKKRIKDMVDTGRLTVHQAIRAEIEGTETMVRGGRYSADGQASALQTELTGAFTYELEKNDLLSLLNSRALDNEIINEIRILEDGNGKASGSKEAKQIADIIHKHKEGVRIRANKAGADIQKIDGHTMFQTHDVKSMRSLGREGWIKFIKPLIDEKLSFGGAADIDTALRNAYDALATGIRKDAPFDVQEPKMFQFTGPSDLGKKLSQSRKIHFKDADSFITYNNAMGRTGLNDSLLQMFSKNGHDIALMERYGSNPEASIMKVAEELSEEYRGIIVDKNESFSKKRIKNAVDEMMGYNSIPDKPTLATVGSNIRLYQTVNKLGAVVFSAIGDTTTKILTYQYHGKSILSSYVQPFLDVTEGFKSKKDKIYFSSLLGVGMEGFIGDVAGRFGNNDDLSQKATKLARLYFKLNGLTWWDGMHKRAMGKIFSHDLALKKGVEFTALDVNTKRMFDSFDITEKDWNNIRRGFAKMDDGREYIFAELVDDKVSSNKLAAYYIDSVNHGVLKGGQKEQRFASLGTQRGTVLGEAVRLFMQFKQYPTAVITRTWGRALYGKGKADIPAIAQLIVLTAVFGYLAGASKDTSRGKTVKDPTDPATIMAAFAQGGGLSFFGEIAFGNASPSEVVTGPTVSMADSVHDIYKATREGKDAKATAAKFVVDSTIPNLFYAKPALDSLLRAHIYEELNPGYTARMEQKMKKDYGQEFYIKNN